jgi:hypothetical protein
MPADSRKQLACTENQWFFRRLIVTGCKRLALNSPNRWVASVQFPQSGCVTSSKSLLLPASCSLLLRSWMIRVVDFL